MPALPRGIWYEPAKHRYRVRKYRNRIPFLIGYFYELDEAIDALNQLDTKLADVPKQRRRHHQRPPACANFRGVAASIHDDRNADPTLYRKPTHDHR